MCLSSGRSLSLTTGQDLCCGSNHCGYSETKPSMSARPPTVWERSTLVPSSQCSKVPAGKGCGIGGWGDLCAGSASQPAPAPPWTAVCLVERRTGHPGVREGQWWTAMIAGFFAYAWCLCVVLSQGVAWLGSGA